MTLREKHCLNHVILYNNFDNVVNNIFISNKSNQYCQNTLNIGEYSESPSKALKSLTKNDWNKNIKTWKPLNIEVTGVAKLKKMCWKGSELQGVNLHSWE